MGFVMAHPGVTSAILGPRTMQCLGDLLAGADVVLSDEILDQIDEVVAPGADAGPMGALYVPPAVTQAASLRRLPPAERGDAVQRASKRTPVYRRAMDRVYKVRFDVTAICSSRRSQLLRAWR
jgi:hypothetical protein